jgi:hypothetical protein
MGYSTYFGGSFEIINGPLHPKIKNFLHRLACTRRMKRNLPEGIYGVEGEFYVGAGLESGGQDHSPDIIDFNSPPKTQPDLWLQWIVDGSSIIHDGGEKFYEYVEWLRYIIDKILAPNGYIVEGKVIWQGEDFSDRGRIIVTNNEISVTILE